MEEFNMLTKEQKEKMEQESKKIADNISHIKHRIVVFSGKGGVVKIKMFGWNKY